MLQLIPPLIRARAERLFALLAVAALAARVIVAYGTAGSDLPQFLAFVESMSLQCPYSTGHPDGMDWPYGWPYPYSILLLVLLRAIHAIACPCLLEYGWEGGVYRVVVDPAWAGSVKLSFIAGDAAASYAIYLLAGRGRLGAALALAYLTSPMAFYVSSVYGMFDPIPAALLLLSLYLLARGMPGRAGLVAGAAAGFKQTAIPGVLGAATAAPAVFGVAAASVAAAAYGAPILACPGDTGFFHWIREAVSKPGLPEPLVYSLNGVSSLAVYLYHRGVEWAPVLTRLWPAAFILLSLASLAAAWRRRDPVVAALLFQASFTATYWRVNPQYTVIVLGLALAAWPRLGRRARAAAAAAYTSLAAWGVLYPQGFWARVHMPRETWAARILDALTIGGGEAHFLVVSLAFTLSLYALVLVSLVETGPRAGRGAGLHRG